MVSPFILEISIGELKTKINKLPIILNKKNLSIPNPIRKWSNFSSRYLLVIDGKIANTGSSEFLFQLPWLDVDICDINLNSVHMIISEK